MTGVGVYDLVMDGAEEEEVVEGVALFFVLVGVVARTIRAASFDVADFANDRVVHDERRSTVGEGTLVARDGKEPFDGFHGW
jgi:hypothetical protein